MSEPTDALRMQDSLASVLVLGAGALAVIGVVAAAAAWFLPRSRPSRVDSTRADAQSVRSASVMYTSENAGQCPSIPDLIEGGYLDRSKRCVDAWDNAFLILCPGDDVIVVSAGPDERLGTEDDIQ